ncbi:MAG TPA: tetratricopeptide repeat protein [Bacteroidales bacterium]|nr:tetratricopeptide repeat protein [Bacteroidales bacterium]
MELAEILRNAQKIDESIDVYEQIIDQFQSNPQLYHQIAMMYLYKEDYKNAIRYYNKIENAVGINERLSVQKQKLYMQIGEKQKAINELEKLIETQPGKVKYYNLLANLYTSEKQFDKAEQVYEKAQKISPDDAYVHINLADIYRKQGKTEQAFQELKKGFKNPDLSFDSKVQILRTYYSVSELYSAQKAQAMTLGRVLVETHPEESRARSVYADFLYRDNNAGEAREQFKKAIQLDSSRFYNWERYLSTMIESSDYQEMTETAKSAKELFPMQPVIYLYSGIAHLQLKSFDKTEKDLTTGIKLVAGNEALKTQFQIYLGEVYHEKKNYDLSDEYFEKAIANDPNNSFTLNNYSYYLSLRGEKLKTAEKYAQKSIELDPENVNNQDTYGWVLFKMKRYEEARFWIQKAYESSENPSGTVVEHLGDVYYELGKVEKAVDLWKEAKEAGETTEEIDEKIKNKSRVVE